jgi:hypothetical protein
MEDMTDKVNSCTTGRGYSIRRHYDCQSSWLVYSVICTDCQVQYVGQTIHPMTHRHYGHRKDVRSGADGLGRHFRDIHGVGLDLTKKEDLAQ